MPLLIYSRKILENASFFENSQFALCFSDNERESVNNASKAYIEQLSIYRISKNFVFFCEIVWISPASLYRFGIHVYFNTKGTLG